MFTILKDFAFEAAHRLPNVPPDHQCHRLHGHGYKVTVKVQGELDPAMGWVIDYADISRAWAPLFAQLDHHYLNEVPGLENSTSEHLARWIWERLKPGLPGLCEVCLRETPTAGTVYTGA